MTLALIRRQRIGSRVWESGPTSFQTRGTMKRFVPLASMLSVILAAFAWMPTNDIGYAQDPPTPVPAPTPTPTVFAKLQGPLTVTAGKAFAIYYDVSTVGNSTWTNSYPADAVPPIKARDEYGRAMLLFFDSVKGDYRFEIEVQYPVPGLDPFARDVWVVHVGTTKPNPRPSPTPTKPKPKPTPTPVPPPAQLTHGYLILIDRWTDRDKSADLRSLKPENPVWSSMREAGTPVINLDADSEEAIKDYSTYVGKEPVLLIFDADRNNAFVNFEPVKSSSDVRTVYRKYFGKDLP